MTGAPYVWADLEVESLGRQSSALSLPDLIRSRTVAQVTTTFRVDPSSSVNSPWKRFLTHFVGDSRHSQVDSDYEPSEWEPECRMSFFID